MKKDKEVKQIFYGYWGEEPKDSNYFVDIGDIADLISKDLEAYKCSAIFPKNVDYFKYSTIGVNQSKEKFGSARIYCGLGNTAEVIKKYNKEKKTKIDLLAYGKDLPEDFKEFHKECLEIDVRHYRSVYLKFKRLFPHYWRAISCCTDFPDFISTTDEEFEELIKNNYKVKDDKAEDKV